MTLLRELGYTVVERDVDRTELYVADEVFFMGTGWEILPVTWVDGLNRQRKCRSYHPKTGCSVCGRGKKRLPRSLWVVD